MRRWKYIPFIRMASPSAGTECPVCYDLKPKNYECENSHFVCDQCLRRCLSCPVCRAHLRTFKDVAGMNAFCTQYHAGCRELGEHRCSRALFHHLSERESGMIKYIIQVLTIDFNYSWPSDCETCLIAMNKLIHLFYRRPGLWYRLLPDNRFRQRVLRVIYDAASSTD